MHKHTVLYIHTVFDPMFLEGVGDKFCGVLISPHFSDDAPDRLAAMQQSVKWQTDRLSAQLHSAV